MSDTSDTNSARRRCGRKRTRQAAGIEPAHGHTALHSSRLQAEHGVEAVDAVTSHPFNVSQPSSCRQSTRTHFSQVSVLTSSDESDASDDGGRSKDGRILCNMATLQGRIRRHLDSLAHFRGPIGASIAVKAEALADMVRGFLDTPEMNDPRVKEFRKYMVTYYIGDPRHIPNSAVGLNSGYTQPSYLPVKWSEVRSCL